MKQYQLFINNQWKKPETNQYITTYNPATGEAIASVASATDKDVDDACCSARKAFKSWSRMDSYQRKDIIQNIARELEKRKDEFAIAEAMDAGKPIAETTGIDIPFSINALDYFSDLATGITGDVIPVKNGFNRGLFDFTTYEPYGVVAVISPFNYPLHLLTRSLAPALAAGNTIVCKASSMTPLTTSMLGEVILAAGVPQGVINIISGSGASCGEALALNREVDIIAFTGSEVVGRRLMELSSKSEVMKKTLLELGGKGPAIIMEDCDMDSSIQSLVLGLCSNQGQVCCAITRLYVQETIYDEFLEKLAIAMNALKLGDTLDPTTQMGTLISKKHLEEVDGFVKDAVSKGARVICGGKQYFENGCDLGNYYLPTVIDNVMPDFKCVKEEIFGPVLSVQKFSHIEEAIEQANHTDFGLGANIFTLDYRLAYQAAQEINAGTVWVNMPNGSQMNCPFGGNKNSGIGREYGMEGLKEYLKIKNNMWNMKGGIFSYYE